MRVQYRLLILSLIVIFVAGACVPAEQSAPSEEAAAAPAASIDTIIFSDLNWASAQIQNRVAQYIVEKGYGLLYRCRVWINIAIVPRLAQRRYACDPGDMAAQPE